MPQRNDLFERRQAAGTLGAGQAGHGQGQGAMPALISQPGQFLLAGGAQWVVLLGRFITQ
ncbi:hypothetical protein D3C71_2102870 [compost metagenome]